jgi:thioredoxin-related protein
MKKILLSMVAVAGIALITVAQTAPLSADILLKNAYGQAGKENKKVFVMFHASWCGWCHKMDASMNDPLCSKFFQDNYVVVHLVVDESKGKENLENPGAKEMRTKYHGDGQGIPYWMVFDKTGTLLADSKMRKEGEGPEAGDNTGCPASEKEVNFFIDILKRTSSINKAQEKIIKERFRKNE